MVSPQNPKPAEQVHRSGDLAPGFVVDGVYEIVSLLGRGGMCTVYKAKHLQLDRLCALKVLNKTARIENTSLQRFQREAKATSLLQHPNIVTVFGFGQTGDEPYLAMELLDGISLAEKIRRDGPLDVRRAVPVFIQILNALQFTHERGIVHRDVKPSNVMLVGEPPTAKLVDFGIARIHDAQGTEQKLTETHAVLGSLAYMSPEQFVGRTADSASDIYAMGCLMFETIMGNAPYVGDSDYAVIYKHNHEEADLSSFPDEKLGKIISACLQKAPEHRPNSAAEVVRLVRAGDATVDGAMPVIRPRRSSAAKLLRSPAAMAVVACVALASGFVSLALMSSVGENIVTAVRKSQDEVDKQKLIEKSSELMLRGPRERSLPETQQLLHDVQQKLQPGARISNHRRPG